MFALDVFQLLDRCGAAVLNLDGRVPDDGAVMEAAVAWTANLPVVIYKTSPITMLGGFDNPMVTGLGADWAYLREVAKLPDEVKKQVATRQSLDTKPFVPTALVASVVALGREVWTVLPEIRQVADQDDPDLILSGVRLLEGLLSPFLVAARLSEPAGNVAEVEHESSLGGTEPPS